MLGESPKGISCRQTYNKLKSNTTELDSHSVSGVYKGEIPNTLNMEFTVISMSVG